MKKLTFFAVAIAALAFTACGGNKSAQNAEEADSIKSFEQEQVEAKIKMELDSLASEVGKLKNLPIVQAGEDGVQLTAEEKQVKPDYLLAPAVAEDAKDAVVGAATDAKNAATDAANNAVESGKKEAGKAVDNAANAVKSSLGI